MAEPCPRGAALIASAAWLMSATATATAMDPAALAAQIEQLRQRHGIAATALVLVDQDRVLVNEVRGVRDWNRAQPVDAETRFRVGSITKTFTAMTLLRAESRGVVQLDRPLRQWMPRAPHHNHWHNRWEATHPLNLAHLLEHTAGWPDMSGAEFDSSDPRPLDLDAALALNPASRNSLWPPGVHHEYSNSGAGLAAWVLQQASGRPFETFMQDEVFGPLGMRSASLVADADTLAHLAQGYDADARTPLAYWHIVYRAAGALNLVPADMAPALRMFLNRGRVDGEAFLTPGQLARMEQPHTTLAARVGFKPGYGLGLRRRLHRGHTVFGHGGDADGYLSRFGYSVEAQRAYFVVITAFKGEVMDTLQALLDDWLVQALEAVKPLPAISLSSQQLTRLSGDYLAASARFPGPDWAQRRLQVRVREGQLETRAQGEKARTLLAVDAVQFRRPASPRATHVFITQPDGSVILQGASGNWRKPPPHAVQAQPGAS